jgi:hypothetical protein
MSMDSLHRRHRFFILASCHGALAIKATSAQTVSHISPVICPSEVNSVKILSKLELPCFQHF